MSPPSDSLDVSSVGYTGWRVVAVCFAMAMFCWGFGFYGHAVYLAELQRLHGWPAGLIGGATTVSYLVSAVLVAFSADAMRRLGPRCLVLLGVADLAVCAALLPHITAPWQLYALYIVMAFSWAALGIATITTLLGAWFTKRRGLAISLALNGASCGGIVIAPALVYLIEWRGFAPAMLIATAALAVMLVPLVFAWIDWPRASRDVTGNGRSGVVFVAAAASWTKPQALRSIAFWSVCAPFSLAMASQVGFIVHQVAFLSPALGTRGAGWAVAVMTTMAVAGRLALGIVIDRLDQRLASAVSFASQAVALLVMMLTENAPVLYLACAVYGVSVGNVITFPALIIQREFDAAAFGMLVALCIAVAQLISGLGPVLVGVVRDAAGSYPAALLVCITLNLVATAAILFRPRRSAS